MKNIIKYSKVLFLLSLVMLLSDCKKNKFLNVNNNPNDPATVPVNLVLPTCEANVGYMVGNTLAIYGGIWAQFWAQDPTYGSQYDAFEEYVNVPGDNDNVWTALYAVGANLNYVIANADTTQKNEAAIAYFMKAYDFQLLSDGWDKVPLTKGLQGTNNFDPTYDPGQQVYDSVENWVYTGLKTIDFTRTSPSEDLIYPNASMAQWQKFAYTLLLKVYVREGQKSPSRTSAGFAKLTAAMNASGVGFMTVPTSPGGDDATFHYTTGTFQQFPLYATQVYLQVQNLCASQTIINYMLSVNDPRIADFYAPSPNAIPPGTYSGELQGDFRTTSGQPNMYASISGEIISPTSSARLLTASESLFLQAEAVVRNYIPGNAGALYASAVTASFKSWPIASTASVTSYLSQPAVNFASAGSSPLNLILTQKWASMCGNQNFEAWTEWRRTGFPNNFTISTSSQISAGAFPQRLAYPSIELNANTNFPGEVAISTPVWWAN